VPREEEQVIIMNEYYYSAVESKNSSRALNNRKNKTNDSVTQDKNRSQDCQRSNERLKSGVFGRRLKAIGTVDYMRLHRNAESIRPLRVRCRKNRPGEDLAPNSSGEGAAIASCASTVVDRGDSETADVLSPTSVDLEQCLYDEQLDVDLQTPDETLPLTVDDDDDADTTGIWIETARSPHLERPSPSSIVWRSREFRELEPPPPSAAAVSDRRRRSEEAVGGGRSRWLSRSPAIEICRPPEPARGEVGPRRRVSGARLPNGIIPGGARSSSPPTDPPGRTRLQPLLLSRPRSESNFAAVAAPVAQRSDVVERLRSFPCRSPGEAEATGRGRRRRTVDLAPSAAAAASSLVSADDVNRSRLGR